MFQLNYEPKRKKIHWLRIILVICLILSSIFIYDKYAEYKYNISKNDIGICGLNNIDTYELIKNPEFDYKISDYLFYGETLNIYHEPYELNKRDALQGKTITLKNLCSGESLMYVLENKIDGQIPLDYLVEGVYAIYLNSNVDLYQLYFDEKIHDEFYTVTRDNSNYKIELIADQNMFDSGDVKNYLNKNYLFLKVTKEKLPEDYYDIVLDAGHSSRDYGYGVEYGNDYNGIKESEVTFNIANAVKKELEKSGLKVLMTRNSNEDVIDSYGENGRLHLGYLGHAKYYIDIQGNGDLNPKYRGMQVFYSSFSSNQFATMLNNELLENTSLVSTGYTTGDDPRGVMASIRADGYDGRKMIRETGGRILGAGTFSEDSKKNAFFNSNSRFGMQAITIEYLYVSNKDDINVYNNELDKIAKATSDGIKKYLGIE